MSLKLSAVQVLALAAVGVATGEWIKRRIPVLERLSIPASIVGGLLYAGATVFWRVEPDLVLRDVLMLACFTMIGLNASFSLIRRGGTLVVLLLGMASLGAVLQNALGMGIARAMGWNPLIGILAGAVSLAGGPATALAFGATFERAGVEGAATIALASAAFGIMVSGLMAGAVGGWLIRRHGARPREGSAASSPAIAVDAVSPGSGLMTHVILIAITMGIGSVISLGIERAGFVVPGYIGAMIVAAAIRYADDRYRWFGISEPLLTALFGVALPLFIVMAMLTLRLSQLAALALPILLILSAQVVLVGVLSLAVYRVMGRGFEAAVSAAGYCGFMLGITANALATMGELTKRYGPAPAAFIAVPTVGAFLIDFTNALIITAMANLVPRAG